MTQATIYSVPLVGPATPTAMAQRIDDNLDAIISGHSGSVRPSYAVAGTVWEDTSVAGTVKYYHYDGSDDILLWTVNTSTNVVTFSNVTPASNQTFGQCLLALSGGNLVLSRKNGRLLTINGVAEVIPSAGVTLSPSGLTPATLYYNYAYMNSGTMTLEASATVPAVDATTGISIKTGDATRTLVGMAYPETGPAFTDTAKKRFVRSWFNDPGVRLFNNFTANRATSSPHTTPQEVNSEIRCQFLLWTGERVEATIAGSYTNGNANGGQTTAVGFNTTTTPEEAGVIASVAASEISPFSSSAMKEGLSEGLNYVTLMGWVSSSGGATFYGDTNGRKTSLMCRVGR